MNNFHRFHNFWQVSNLFSQIWLKKRHTSLFSGNCREIGTNFMKQSQKKCKIWREKWKKSEFNIQSRKNVGDFWLKFWDWRTMQRSALCRSRRELSNEYLLAKSASIQPRTSPSKFGEKFNSLFTSLLRTGALFGRKRKEFRLFKSSMHF